MKHVTRLQIIATTIIISLISCLAHCEITARWEKIKEKNNVLVFKADIPGTDVVAFRGVSDINAPIENVVSVIHDVSRIKEWMSDLKSSHIVEQKSKFEKIEYNRTTAPWPISDRDFVYSVNVKVDKANKSVDILIENAVHTGAPEVKSVVRGLLHSSRYFIKTNPDGKSTHIEVEILADPKGSIPKWVVNLFQSGWPSNTINGIRKIATEPNYKVHSDVAEFIKTL